MTREGARLLAVSRYRATTRPAKPRHGAGRAGTGRAGHAGGGAQGAECMVRARARALGRRRGAGQARGRWTQVHYTGCAGARVALRHCSLGLRHDWLGGHDMAGWAATT